MTLIPRDKSIIPACDVEFDVFERLVRATANIEGVGAYKLGAALALSVGLEPVVKVIREHSDKPIIYDHQKAGSDIPDTAEYFMEILKKAGVDSVILFPLAGPATQRAWTSAAVNQELHVIVGGMMTHSRFLTVDGGYMRDDAPTEIYEMAASNGVTDFVVPGTRPDVIKSIRGTVSRHAQSPIFYAPGFITQGGKITDAAKAAGNHWHAIIGRAIYEAADMQTAAQELCATI